MEVEKENLKELDDLLKVPWLVEVDKLNSTQSFGELALINNEPRAA